MAQTRVALFDLDRTLVRMETASLFVRYRRDRGEATFRDTVRVAYWAAQYTFGRIDASDVAARALAALSGLPEAELVRQCEEWFPKYVAQHICARARRAVDTHLFRGNDVAIVTGASPYAARPVARALGIEHVVASDLEVDGSGLLTGRFVEPLCYGIGKKLLALRLGRRLGFTLEEAMFYSDSATDLPLLQAVGEPVAVNPDRRLRRVAEQLNWRIEHW